MADHFPDSTKKVDFISRKEALELIDNAPIIAGSENETLISAPELSDKVYCLPLPMWWKLCGAKIASTGMETIVSQCMD